MSLINDAGDSPQQGQSSGDIQNQPIEKSHDSAATQRDAGAHWHEQHLASLLEYNPDAIFQVDRDGQFLLCNPAAEQLCGYSDEELRGHSFVPLIHPKELRRLREAIARAMEGEPQCHESSLLHRDGRRIELLLALVPAVSDGTVDSLYIVARDDNQRRSNLHALRLSEERYRTFIAQSSEGIWCFELELPIPMGRDEDEYIEHFFRYAFLAECNDAFARMYGYQHAKEIQGLRLSDFLVPGDEHNIEYLRAFVRSDFRLYDAESHELDRDGNTRYFLNNLTGIVRDGLFLRAWGMQRDVTDRMRSAKNQEFLMAASIAVSASLNVEANLKQVAELAVPDFAALCVVVLDGDKSPHVLDLRCKDSEIEAALRESVASDSVNMWPVTVRVLERGRLEYFPTWNYRAQIGEHLVQRNDLLEQLGARSCIGVPMTTAGVTLGAILFVSSSGHTYDENDVALAEDIGRRAATAVQNAQLLRAAQEAQRGAETARREAESAQQEAEAANRAKDEFLAMVSHELRTPLTPVLGWVHLLRTTGLDTAQAANALETVERNTRAQAQIVNDLLDISRIVTGKLQLHLEETDLQQVIESAVDTLRVSTEQSGIHLNVESHFLGTARCDADRIQQVVLNLIANAIKFTPAGGTIRVLAHAERHWIQLEVRDNGNGIEPEFLPYVFDRFRQGDTASTRRHGGLGLGLSIVRHIVELHGGTVTVHSDGVGEGTTFKVRLPRNVSTSQEEANEIESAEVAESQNANKAPERPLLHGIRVLVVDDEQDTRELIAAVLLQVGAQLQCAESAAQAFEMLHERTPDLIISDIAMPEEDGLSLLRRIRASGFTSPIVALTARARPEDRVLSLESGFNEHLTKPVEPRYLVETVAQLMHREK
jgi:PAS domain S-box-containing protein